MSETHRNPKVATEADLAELKARLEQAQQDAKTSEQPVVAEAGTPVAEVVSSPVDTEPTSTVTPEVVTPPGV